MLEPLVQVEHLKKFFQINNETIKAIDDICFTIYEGETLGIVGESGSGKSTLGRLLLRLDDVTDGDIYYRKRNITHYTFSQMQPLRRQMQIIFQDPYASLNPRMTIGDIILEPLYIHHANNSIKMEKKAEELLTLVGLDPSFYNRFPHELSGGQRQRIGIARALCLEPKFIVCDEPISALDVSVQAQIVNLLKTLQKDKNLTYLFIAHDLSMVKYISNRVAVMYHGKIVELASSNDLYNDPLHPYTQALLSAQPLPDPKIERNRKKIILQEDSIDSKTSNKGCVFCRRCPKASKACAEIKPKWKMIREGHFVACHLYDLSS